MDILTYIDRVKANYSKQPEPVYNTKKYFMGGSVTKPKRGLVDEGTGLKKDGTVKSEYMIKGSRLPKGKLTLYNKYAQLFFNKDWKDLNEAESERVENAGRKGKFIKTNQFDQLTDLNQEKIKKSFPDIKFEFKPGQKLGVPKKLPNGKFNPVNDAVSKFIRRGYKKSLRKSLPVNIQRDIVSNFELPKGVKEWNFNVAEGGNIYGIPETGQNNATNKNLGARIRRFVENPINYKVAADFSTPDGWLLNQMYRAHLYNDNYIPKYDLVNGKKKIVAFTDNQFGEGKTYYALKKYANKFNGIRMSEHPDYQNTKKYIDIANKVRLSPNEVIKDLLIKGGVKDDRVTLNTLLNFIVNKKGVEPTKRALVLHHKGGMSSPTRDIQILNASVNQNIVGIERAMRSNSKNITPENIKKLKDFGASITIDGKTYGGGPKTAIGGFREAEKLVESKLESFGKKDFTELKKYISAIGCPGKGRADGGRIGFSEGADCFNKGQKAINSGKIAKGAQGRNLSKLLNSVLTKSGTGLRAVIKFGIIPEALFLGAESLIRLGMGDTLDEAIKRSTGYFRPGDQTREANTSMLTRLIGPENAKTALRVRDYEQSLNNLNSAKVNAEVDLAQNMEEFSGVSNRDIQIKAEQEKKDAERDLIFKFRPEAERDQAARLELEAADRFGTKSVFKKFEENARKQDVDDVEQTLAPEITQKDLNKRMGDPVYGMDDIAESYISDEQINDLRKKTKIPNLTKKELFDIYRRNPNFNKGIFKGLFEEARQTSAGQEQLFGASGKPFGDYISNPQREGMDRMKKLMNIPGVKGVADMATGGLANLTTKTAPKKGPQSEGLAYFMKHGRK